MNSHLCYYHPLTHLAPINHKPLPSSITIGIYSQIDDLASHFTLPIKLHTSFGELNFHAAKLIQFNSPFFLAVTSCAT